MTKIEGKKRRRAHQLGSAAVLLASMALAGCEDGQMPAFLQAKDAAAADDGSASTVSRAGTIVERDVEAPEIFQVTEAGLWDGRPSLGGVWAAHPDVKDPERIIVRNETNGKFVIGALFRRERETPGPRLQISSDAAAALGMLAGQPTNLNVVALRREEAADPAPTADIAPIEMSDAMPAPADVSAAPLDDDDAVVLTASPAPAPAVDPVAATAAAALDTAVITPAAAPAPSAAPAPRPTSALSKPFLQIGIFSVEENARNTATVMRQAGIVPTVLKQSSKGKTFWRVVVGPAQTKAERDTLLAKIKTAGFTDAYAVTN